jgi:membrane-bound serine protease (ClpP class)
MKRLLTLLILVFSMGLACSAPNNNTYSKVMIARIDGAIDPAIAKYIERGINLAESKNANAFIISMDTPGGLDDSMRTIVKRILASRIPVVVYVSPQGARAASAGAIIALSANIAAMSPGTSIGAAHPVNLGGETTDSTMMKKIENDAASYAKDLALKRGRNVDWAAEIVRNSISSTSREALEKNVINLIAEDMPDLIKKIDGMKIKTSAGEVVLSTKGADVQNIPLTYGESLLHFIANPNLAYLFMMLAMYGIIFELSNPGAILPGVVGGISLIIALISFAVLPINAAGLLLLFLGIILLIVDLFVPSHGILTVGGLVSFVIGSFIMFDTPQSPVYQVSFTLVITFTILTGAFFVYAIAAGIRAQRSNVVTGSNGMIGLKAVARTDLNPSGKVYVEGEWWNAVTEGEMISEGEKVIITDIDKLLLTVRKEKNN